MKKATALCAAPAAVALLLALEAGPAFGQDVRVLLIRSPDARAVPPDAWRTFRQAVASAAPGVTLVPSAALATDLVELMRYDWDPGGKLGVTQTWRFYYTPLPKPDSFGRTPARPHGHILIAPGKTLAESTELSAQRLRMTLRQLLGVEPVVPVVPTTE